MWAYVQRGGQHRLIWNDSHASLSLSHSHFLWYAQLVEILSCGYGHELSAGKWEINGCKEAVYILCKKKKMRQLRTGIDAGIELCNRFAPFWLKLRKEQHTLLQLFCLSLKYIYICRSCPTMRSPREKCHAEHSGIGIVHNVLTGCSAAGHVKPFHAVSKAVLKLEQTDHTNGQPMLISPPHWEL